MIYLSHVTCSGDGVILSIGNVQFMSPTWPILFGIQMENFNQCMLLLGRQCLEDCVFVIVYLHYKKGVIKMTLCISGANACLGFLDQPVAFRMCATQIPAKTRLGVDQSSILNTTLQSPATVWASLSDRTVKLPTTANLHLV